VHATTDVRVTGGGLGGPAQHQSPGLYLSLNIIQRQLGLKGGNSGSICLRRSETCDRSPHMRIARRRGWQSRVEVYIGSGDFIYTPS
jgi:hypothetical protein